MSSSEKKDQGNSEHKGPYLRPPVSVSSPRSLLSFPNKTSFSPRKGAKVLDNSAAQKPRKAVQVFDERGNDVTPRPLYKADPGKEQGNASRFLVDLFAGAVPGQTTATETLASPLSGSFLGSCRSTFKSSSDSLIEDFEDRLYKQDVPINLPAVGERIGRVKEQVTEYRLNESNLFSTTDLISLVDIPSTVVSVEAGDADVVIEQTKNYAEICRTRPGNEKFVDQYMQTMNLAPKSKQVQTAGMVTKDSGSWVTTWDLFDTFSDQPEAHDYPTTDVESRGNLPSKDSEEQLFPSSESFKQCVVGMERILLQDNIQPLLAVYCGLPVIEDPDSVQRPETMEQIEEDTEGSPSPALECLWVYSCKLTRGRGVSSMAWNKKESDMLAVGYGEAASGNQPPGLVCSWSIKNILWPQRVIDCNSAVTSLDFSAKSPSELAVSMKNGSIEIHHLRKKDKTLTFSSRDYVVKNSDVMHQLVYNQQDLSLAGETESLVSVGNDGRVLSWSVSREGLEYIELMRIELVQTNKKKESDVKKSLQGSLSPLIPGLCLDFHPTESDIYLIGTLKGLIHKCSYSGSHQFLETYKKHLNSVTCVTWSPFSPNFFLSCSLDSAIHLWNQDQCTPVLRFSSSQKPVRHVQWSPKHATVFGAVSDRHLDIWDLSVSTLDPIIVLPAAPGRTMTSLLFTSQTDCILVGDSDGRVSVYLLKNLHKEESNQVDVLNEVLLSKAVK